MPIRVNGQVLGCVNLTWRMKVLTVRQVAERYLGDLRAAIHTVQKRAVAAGMGATAKRNPTGLGRHAAAAVQKPGHPQVPRCAPPQPGRPDAGAGGNTRRAVELRPA